MVASMEDWEEILTENKQLDADIRTLKKLSDALTVSLATEVCKTKILQQNEVELKIVIDGTNKVNGDLRTSINALSKILEDMKKDIFNLTARLKSSDLEAKAKGDYIDRYMKVLKDDAQEKHHQARIAEDILRSVYDKITECGQIPWARGEILDLIDETRREIENDPT
jgi:hypothetical protein